MNDGVDMPPPDPRDGEGKITRRACNRIAEQIILARQRGGSDGLVTDRTGSVYGYNGMHWRELPKTELAALALAFAGATSSSADRAEIVEYLKAATFDVELKWGRCATHEIACLNGVVDVRTLELRPHRAPDYLERVLPIDWQLVGARCPEWEKALAAWFGSTDAPEASALQEFFGYVGMQHAKFKKALVLKGPSNTAKSLIVQVAEAVVGEEFVSALGVEDMDDPQRRAVLKGKALNIITELSADAIIRDGGFKTLVSSEDRINVDEKYKPVETYRPTAKHMIATNVLPAIRDRSEATIDRLLIVPTLRVFSTAEQDRGLKDRLTTEAELEGILRWLVIGANRLIERGGAFEQPPSARPILAELREESNPVMMFIQECLVVDAEGAVPLAALVVRYNKWQGGGRAATVKQLGKMLRGVGQVTKAVRQKGDQDGRIWRSLIGYRMTLDVDDAAPRRFKVELASAASPAEEIEGVAHP